MVEQQEQEQKGSKIKIIISDCHLSAGSLFEGRLNVHEDFHFDQEICDFLRFFSSGDYAKRELELFINGDFLDFLNVPREGEFDDVIDEELALWKLNAVFNGHPEVMEALRSFASCAQKKITYLIGNHDADLFFPAVREAIVRKWDPNSSFPSTKVELIAHTDRVRWEDGVEVRHGNQLEAVHVLNFEQPFVTLSMLGGQEKEILNLPWGSFYVLKIVNRLKWEREFIDKVRPVKLFVIIGLLVDTWFTLRFSFLSLYYFLQTRLIYSPRRRSSLKVTAEILKPEIDFLLDLERQARRLLDQDENLKVLILGHTHKPMNKLYADGKQYINTGTWTKMINLDWRNLGQRFCLTFAYLEWTPSGVRAELREWKGESGPHVKFKV